MEILQYCRNKKYLFIFGVSSITALTTILLALIFLKPEGLTDYNEFKTKFKFSNSYLFSEDGRLISSIRNDFTKRNLIWSDLNEIDSKLIQKVIQREDKRFLSHMGFDILSLFGSIRDSVLENKKMRGFSTITMQFVKINWKLNTKSPLDKIKQIFYSYRVERVWNKNEILEAYFNTIYFQSDIQGIGTASLLLLDKMPINLTENEINFFLEKIKNPSALKKSISANPLVENGPTGLEHYHRHLLKKESFTAKKSTINFDLQVAAEKAIKRNLERLKDNNVHDAAVLVIRNSDGYPVAYVGNSGVNHSSTPYVNMVLTKRPAGSTLKPFLYGLALEKKLISLQSWIDDSPVDIIFENGTYSPKNHDQNFYGWIQVPTALASSLNVPAVKLIQMTGVESFWNTLKEFNLNPNKEPDYYGPSLALGTLEVSLWDLTNAYSQLSGIRSNSVFSENTRNIINWILSEPQHRSLTFGLNSILNLSPQIAVKTGTSKDMKDNWCIAYSRDYTVGVWVGNSDNSPMYNVLGVTGAAPIARDVFEAVKMINKNEAILVSAENSISFQKLLANSHKPEEFKKSRIISPAPNSIYAIDPSIPIKNQKLFLEADGPQSDLIWKFNGLTIHDNKITIKKGRHKVELYRRSLKIDESTFLVK